MKKQMTTSPMLTPSLITSEIQSLTNGLSAIQPANSETTQIITYTLIATAVVGIFVYHYIKEQEAC